MNPKIMNKERKTGWKKPVILFLSFLLLQLPVYIRAQENSIISLNMQNVPLSKILKEVKKQSGKSILFSNKLVDRYQHETIRLQNADLEEALDKILEGKLLKYKMVDDVIIIEPVKQENNVPGEPAELYQVVKGQVIDKDSKMPLPGANVFIEKTNPVTGTITDTDGYFTLEKVPVGRHTIAASFLGYEKSSIPETMVGSGKEVVLKIELTESIQELEEVIVKSEKGKVKNEMADVSSRSFSVEETRRYAASFADPGRMALAFAGTASSDDVTNELIVRGNSPNYLQYRIEGIEIPNPNHFAEDGSSSGAVSILSAYILDKSDFLTGAFPAEYGNVLSGVFDLSLRKGNAEKREYAFQAGLLGLDFSTEGPFSHNYNGSYIINYRYSTLGILDKMKFVIEEHIPSYQDLSFKVNLPVGKFGYVSLWGLGGADKGKELPVEDSTKWESGSDKRKLVFMDYMLGTGITHTFFPDKKTYFRSVMAYTQNGSEMTQDTLNNEYQLSRSEKMKFYNAAIRTSFLINRKINARLTARAGFKANFIENNHRYEGYDDELDIWREYVKGSGKTQLYQAYVQAKYKISEKLTFIPGLNYIYFDLSGEKSWEPRGSIKYQFTSDQSIAFAIGKHSRHENIGIYYIRFLNEDNTYSCQNNNLKLVKSWHYVASYEIHVTRDFSLKLEAYYQYLYNVPVTRDTASTLSLIGNDPDIDYAFESTGTGRNLGIELTVEKNFTNNYYFLFTSSIFDSKYRAADKKWYNTAFNYKYLNTMIAGKEFYVKEKNRNVIGINGKFIWQGGMRDTPIDEELSRIEQTEVYLYDKINSIKYKDYLRLDVGFSYRINKSGSSQIFSLDIQNVTNRENIRQREYDSSEDEFVYDEHFGILPILSYKIEF